MKSKLWKAAKSVKPLYVMLGSIILMVLLLMFKSEKTITVKSSPKSCTRQVNNLEFGKYWRETVECNDLASAKRRQTTGRSASYEEISKIIQDCDSQVKAELQISDTPHRFTNEKYTCYDYEKYRCISFFNICTFKYKN